MRAVSGDRGGELDTGGHVDPSRRFNVSFTSCGFALPFVAFITWPTKNPNSAVLPAR